MKSSFINSAVSISSQETFNADVFETNQILLFPNEKIVNAIKPNYKEYISPVKSRRMASGVKMGVVTAKKALNTAEVSEIDAIITGTGLGCIEDSEKFLDAVIDNDEQYLTPTSFIQSTHNTVAAQIALLEKSNAYNVTYVNGANSFEAALIDAQMQLNEGSTKILVGGVDELGNKFIKEYCKRNTQKVPFSEGANFFVIENEKKENTLAELVDVCCFQKIKEEDLENKVILFLKENKVELDDIDAICLGINGSEYDSFYTVLQKKLFKETTQLQYKNVCGEFYTASAFGLYTSVNLLRKKELPKEFYINNIVKKEYKHVLLYNQYKGTQHSLVLVKRC